MKCEESLRFSGVYAKVVEINANEIRLRFTHLNKDVEEFIAQLNLGKGIAYDDI